MCEAAIIRLRMCERVTRGRPPLIQFWIKNSEKHVVKRWVNRWGESLRWIVLCIVGWIVVWIASQIVALNALKTWFQLFSVFSRPFFKKSPTNPRQRSIHHSILIRHTKWNRLHSSVQQFQRPGNSEKYRPSHDDTVRWNLDSRFFAAFTLRMDFWAFRQSKTRIFDDIRVYECQYFGRLSVVGNQRKR